VLKITSTPLIDVEIDDELVRFFGDPPDTALLELFRVQDRFGGDTEQTLEAIGGLRAGLAGLVAPESLEAWASLVAAGKITLAVTMTLFEYLTTQYGEALGFRGGQHATSTGGLPVNADTSEEYSPAAAPV
jgi:hypothetical protein